MFCDRGGAVVESRKRGMRMQDRYLFKAKTARIADTYNNTEDGICVKGSLKEDCGKYTIFQFEFDRGQIMFLTK